MIGYDAQKLRELSNSEHGLRAVHYRDELSRIYGYNIVTEPAENTYALLSLKSNHWSYENEWRLIVELNETIGTGVRDRHDQPINLVRVPNPAVVSVYCTERTPTEAVDLVLNRLANPNNRYSSARPTKLISSALRYGYEDDPGTERT